MRNTEQSGGTGGKKHAGNNRGDFSSTIQIPIDEIFEGLHTHKSASIRISCPGQEDITVQLNGNELMMGRDENCDLPLAISSVSWHHARIVTQNEDFAVEDMDSTNGTFVNNVRVSRCVLHNHDIIRVGEASIVFTKQVSTK